jgi:hypothetical protein
MDALQRKTRSLRPQAALTGGTLMNDGDFLMNAGAVQLLLGFASEYRRRNAKGLA